MHNYPVLALPVADLKPHPRNYRQHPEEQLDQLATSIQEHGIYRNIVTARDLTILAGHGIVEACQLVGVETVNGVVLDLDPEDPQALKILAADNMLSKGSQDDDHLLVAILEQVAEEGISGLMGTGFSQQSLSAFKAVIAPPAASHRENVEQMWAEAGMPEYDPGPTAFGVHVVCDTEESRDRLVELAGIEVTNRKARFWSANYPGKGSRDDLTSLTWDAD